MISTYVIQLNPNEMEPVLIQVPVGAAAMTFTLEQGPGQVSFLVDDTQTDFEERTVLFAYDGQPGVMTPAPAVDGISLSTFTFLGSSRGWHCWIL